jgi:hypothetical protein
MQTLVRVVVLAAAGISAGVAFAAHSVAAAPPFRASTSQLRGIVLVHAMGGGGGSGMASGGGGSGMGGGGGGGMGSGGGGASMGTSGAGATMNSPGVLLPGDNGLTDHGDPRGNVRGRKNHLAETQVCGGSWISSLWPFGGAQCPHRSRTPSRVDFKVKR